MSFKQTEGGFNNRNALYLTDYGWKLKKSRLKRIIDWFLIAKFRSDEWFLMLFFPGKFRWK